MAVPLGVYQESLVGWSVVGSSSFDHRPLQACNGGLSNGALSSAEPPPPNFKAHQCSGIQTEI